ncbi:hypothetical protein LV79_002797 [Actinokineospora globicatena]|nr:hypothetical protein [Actinokineospora globicatena]MCP2303092.1 hypothetical protein [Actinokineospora globicatena]GLW79794.1 hypothetical protein Aglo01_42750 [Actinokineospora globicatena]GLW85796.1 hypothetical protein Aglo02_34360 [Actinokineospora globicatena]
MRVTKEPLLWRLPRAPLGDLMTVRARPFADESEMIGLNRLFGRVVVNGTQFFF